jgi:hypothetical protein
MELNKGNSLPITHQSQSGKKQQSGTDLIKQGQEINKKKRNF